MKITLLAASLCAIGLSCQAQQVTRDAPLDRLTRPDELSGWEAVGRVDIRGGGYCTGALIAPDLVLTAAHCLVDKASGKAFDPTRVLFRAGYSDGHSVAERNAMQTVVHPEYTDRDSKRYDTVSTDVALIRLVSPIPTVVASPFKVGEQIVGHQVSVVSYARGRSEAPSWQRSCAVKARSVALGAAAFTCNVDFGSSGAPVFDTTRRSPQIVSVISRGHHENGATISWGPIIQTPVAELQEALRTSRGVNQAGGGLASVVRQTEGARFVKPGQATRFVRP